MDEKVRGTPIPVIDLFAGPGGLSEGFSDYKTSTGYHPFDIRLAIEKDLHAHTTLKLRSFFRQFSNKPQVKVPPTYYEVLQDTSRPLPSSRSTAPSGIRPLDGAINSLCTKRRSSSGRVS